MASLLDGPAAPAEQFELRQFLGLLWRQRRLLALTIVVVLAIATISLTVMRPAFTASALVLVDPNGKNLLNPDGALLSGSESARVDSEVELVRSEANLLAVARNLRLIDDPAYAQISVGWFDRLRATFGTAPEKPQDEAMVQASVLARLRDAVAVQRRGLTYVIAVSARSSTPAAAAELANAVADAYIAAQVEAKVNATLAARDAIESRITDAGAAVSNSEAAFDHFLSENVDTIARWSGKPELAAMRNDLSSADQLQQQLSARSETAAANFAAANWPALAETLQSAALRGLVAQRDSLAARMGLMAPDRDEGFAQIDDALQREGEVGLGALKTELGTTQARVADLRARLRSGVLQSDLPPAVLAKIYELQQNNAIARTQYQTLLSRLKDLEAQAYLQVADSRIASPAVPPDRPSSPNARLTFSLAGVAALALGIGLAVLNENFVGGFTSAEQLQAVLRTPVVAAIPRQRGRHRQPNGEHAPSQADLLADAPLSMFAEAIRRIRVGVDQSLRWRNGAEGGSVILVTSSGPGEGKTTTALALARAYALSGRSTLLIDCDLRKPSLHQQLGLELSAGLMDYLRAENDGVPLNAILVTDTKSDAQIVLGARRSERATDQLIAGRAFARLIEAARRNVDVVILDSPPVGSVVDALYAAPYADSVVTLVRWAQTSQRDGRATLDAINAAKRPETECLAVLAQQELPRSLVRPKLATYYSGS